MTGVSHHGQPLVWQLLGADVTSEPDPTILRGLAHESSTMTKTSKQYMSVFALSAAALFLGGCKDKGGTEPPEGGDGANADQQVKCFGVNECAGESVCAVNKPQLGIEHSCAGENDCKGKGWIKITRAECEEQNGEVLGVL